MNHVNRYVQTFFQPRFIAEAGKRAIDLKPYELGLFDNETGLSVDVANYCPDNSYIFKLKSPSKGMNNTMFGDTRGTQLPLESYPIKRIDKTASFDAADAKGKPYVYYLGWDGISDCKTLSFECGKNYGLQVTVRGERVRSTFGHNITEIIPFTTGCCEDCSLDEAGDITIQNILKAIDNDTFYINRFNQYFKVEAVKSCCPEEAPFDKKIYHNWRIDICDTGDTKALADLQSQYPMYNIECYARKGVTTTYEVCLADGITPSDYVQTTTGLLVCDDCEDCPTSFTKIEGGDKYIVGLLNQTGIEDFSTPALIDTALASVPGYIAGSGTLMGTEKSNATFEVCVATDTVITPIAGHTFMKVGVCSPRCEGQATFTWSNCEEVYKINRTLCLTFKKEDCERPDSYYLDQVASSLVGAKDIEEGTLAIRNSNDCLIEFTVNQCNNDCLRDGCDTYGKDGAKFDSIDAFSGITWKMCDCEGWEVDALTGCLVAPESTIDNCLYGLKFTGTLVDQECLPCVSDISDHISREPIQLEFTLIEQYSEESCDPLMMPITEVQTGVMPQGLGQYAKRNEVLSRIYDTWIYTNPKEELGGLMAQRLGYEYSTDSCDTYNYLYIRHNFYRNNNYYQGHQGGHREEICFAVESDNVALFENLKTFLNKTLLSHGVCKLL